MPRSVRGPHGVLVNEGFRYPRRTGSVTSWLTQPEVRAAYFETFAAEREREDQVLEVERQISEDLSDSGLAYVVLSLVPELPGRTLTVGTESFNRFQAEVLDSQPLILCGKGWSFSRAEVRVGQFTASSSPRSALGSTLRCRLWETGSAAFAARVADFHDKAGNPANVPDEWIADTLLGGLAFLGAHARDRAGAGGNAFLRASLVPVAGRDVQLVQLRTFPGASPEELGDAPLRRPTSAVTIADIDELAAGPGLARAAQRLGNGLVQAFGLPEMLQFTPDGALRLTQWMPSDHESLQTWSSGRGIATVEGDPQSG